MSALPVGVQGGLGALPLELQTQVWWILVGFEPTSFCLQGRRFPS